MRKKSTRNFDGLRKEIGTLIIPFCKVKNIVTSYLSSPHGDIFGRSLNVHAQPLSLNANQHSVPQQNSSNSVDKVVRNRKPSFKLFDLRNQLFMRHGSTLSIIPRSELERIEKRGLEVRG